MKTAHANIDVYEGTVTLKVDDESVVFHMSSDSSDNPCPETCFQVTAEKKESLAEVPIEEDKVVPAFANKKPFKKKSDDNLRVQQKSPKKMFSKGQKVLLK